MNARSTKVRLILAAATLRNAMAIGRGQELGSIVPGKRADLVVLDRNLFGHPADEIALAQVDLTIVGGLVVHAR